MRDKYKPLPPFLCNTDAACLAGVNRKTMLQPVLSGEPARFTDANGEPVEPLKRFGPNSTWRWPTERLIEALELTEEQAYALLTNPHRPTP